MDIRSEQLAYWYLRLNGFLTIPNFVVHPDRGADQRTEVDVLGIRFPHRAELFYEPMQDDPKITCATKKPQLVIAEAKVGLCDFNKPWLRPEGQNLQRILRAVGMFPLGDVDPAAAALYEHGSHETEFYIVRLVCFGTYHNHELRERFPLVPQFTWDSVLAFIYNRFRDYERQKVSHGQWDQQGQNLWDTATRNQSVEEFTARVQVVN
jgi:hypothetical protein